MNSETSSHVRRSAPPFFLLLALIYGLILASLPIDQFVDRDNYLNYAENSSLIFSLGVSNGPLFVLFNEPLWLLLNIALGLIFSPENVLRLIIFVSASVFAFRFSRILRASLLLLIFFILAPQILKNYITHLRQGVAIAFFIAGWSLVGWRRIALFVCACTIHSSFFFIVALWVACKFLTNYRLGGRRISGGFILLAISALVILGAVILPLAIGFTGARQSEVYADGLTEGSGLSFVFWSLMMAGMLTQRRDWIEHNAFSVAIVAFYVATYFVLPFAARIFESGLPFVVAAVFLMRGALGVIAVTLTICYFLIQWFPFFMGSAVF